MSIANLAAAATAKVKLLFLLVVVSLEEAAKLEL